MDKAERYVRGLQHALRSLENNADDLGWVERDMARAAVSQALAPQPLDTILHCPVCHTQHVDEPDERTPGWVNPPHRSHLCHACGCIWRPADVATNGVRDVATRGKADTWPALHNEEVTAALAALPSPSGGGGGEPSGQHDVPPSFNDQQENDRG